MVERRSRGSAKTRVNIVNTLAVQGIRGAQTYIGINDAVASAGPHSNCANLMCPVLGLCEYRAYAFIGREAPF